MEPSSNLSWRKDCHSYNDYAVAFSPDRFHKLVTRFCGMKYVRKEDDNRDINTVIDELTSFRLSAKSVNEKDISSFIRHCCSVITPDLGQLSIKCCLLLSYMICRSEVDLDSNLLIQLVKYLTYFVTKFDKWAYPDILQALKAALTGRGGRLPLEVLDDLVTTETGLLHRILFDSESDIMARKSALQCVGAVCLRCEPYMEDFYASQCLNIFLSVLKTRFPKADEFMQCKLLSIALEGIHEVTSNTKTAHGSILGELLAALKAYSFFGRDDPSVNMPTCLQPVHMGPDVPPSLVNPAPPPRPQKKQTKKKTRTRKIRSELTASDDEGGGGDTETISRNSCVDPLPWRQLSESESDYSDTETAAGVTSKYQTFQRRVRQYSLTTLCTVIKASMKRLIFGYWASFFPTGPDDVAGTLAAVLKDETSSRVKTSALAAVAAFLDRSKSALLVATERESSSTTPFTPFSVLLGNMIKELHNTLLTVIKTESSHLTLTQAVKCLSTLINNSPYQKLRPGLLSKSVKLLRPYLSHKDTNIRVAALTSMGAMVTIHAPLIEVSHILLPPTAQENVLEGDSTKSSGEGNSRSSGANSLPSTPPSLSAVDSQAKSRSKGSKDAEVMWLIKTCSRCIFSSSAGATLQLPIRLEALQVLSCLVAGYLPLIRSSLHYLTNIIVEALADADPSVQLHGAKTAESLGRSINKHFQQQELSREGDDSTFSLDEALTFWSCLLSGPLVQALQNSSNSQLRATCCLCLANIGGQVFERIETNQQIVCITMLLGLTSDPEIIVRDAAIRATGVFVLYPCQRRDVSFVADTANAALLSMKDESTPVQIRASWVMANVTDALVLNMASDDFPSFAKSFSDVLLLRLIDVATEACYGDDKMKYNGVRALGNLLKYLQPHTLERRSMSQLIESSVNLLVKWLSQGVMKVRWNASYALGSLLQNDYIVSASAPWLEQVHDGLGLAMKTCKNFKVRINSVQAIQMAATRSKYGGPELFSRIWKNVVEAMNESTNAEDFTDYKHISSLSHQLSKAILHLTSLIESDDLVLLRAVLFGKENTIKSFLEKSPENLDRKVCLSHLNSLEKKGLDAEKLSVVNSLTSILAATDTEVEDEKSLKSTFKPSYD